MQSAGFYKAEKDLLPRHHVLRFASKFTLPRLPFHMMERSQTTMIRAIFGCIALMVAATLAVGAPTNPDEEAVRRLPQAFCAAFNNHDGHELAKIMADDVDFVTVGAYWLHGRPDFEKYHTRMLRGRFAKGKMEPLRIAVRFLRPDIAIIHWSWTGLGDINIDGTARVRRYGMMTMVAEKRNGMWLVAASQNDDADPTISPEMDGITPPIPIPGPEQKPQ
jgi:uncharacterized protein (TIGR02246 family)